MKIIREVKDASGDTGSNLDQQQENIILLGIMCSFMTAEMIYICEIYCL